MQQRHRVADLEWRRRVDQHVVGEPAEDSQRFLHRAARQQRLRVADRFPDEHRRRARHRSVRNSHRTAGGAELGRRQVRSAAADTLQSFLGSELAGENRRKAGLRLETKQPRQRGATEVRLDDRARLAGVALHQREPRDRRRLAVTRVGAEEQDLARASLSVGPLNAAELEARVQALERLAKLLGGPQLAVGEDDRSAHSGQRGQDLGLEGRFDLGQGPQPVVEPGEGVGDERGEQQADDEAEDRVAFRRRRELLDGFRLDGVHLPHIHDRQVIFELVDLADQVRGLQGDRGARSFALDGGRAGAFGAFRRLRRFGGSRFRAGFDAAYLTAGEGDRRFDRAVVFAVLAPRVGLGRQVHEQRCARGALGFRCDRDEGALFGSLGPDLPRQRGAPGAGASLRTQLLADRGADDRRVDQDRLGGRFGCRGLLAGDRGAVQRDLFFGPRGEIDLGRRLIGRFLVLVVEVRPGGDEDADRQNKPAAPPDRREHRAGVSGLVHGSSIWSVQGRCQRPRRPH